MKLRHGALEVPSIAALALVLSACGGRAGGPEPTLSLPAQSGSRLGRSVDASLRLTVTVNAEALRRPPLHAIVDAEITAMADYVATHGRGFSGESLTRAGSSRPSDEDAERVELTRLAAAESRLASYLPFDSGPAELEAVAARALGRLLGEDAAIRAASAEHAGPRMLVPKVEGNVGVLVVPDLGDGIGDRIASVFEQWLTREHPLGAIVLDLSDCEAGQPAAAAAIASLFGATSPLGVSFRDSRTGALRAGMLRSTVGDRAPVSLRLFVLTSRRTGSVAEALVFALRERGATVLGGRTPGTGRLMLWGPNRGYGAFGFTVADLVGSDGLALHGRPIIPDACIATTGHLTRGFERTVPGYEKSCQSDPSGLPMAEVVDFVRGELDAAPRTNSEPSRLLERGEEHG